MRTNVYNNFHLKLQCLKEKGLSRLENNSDETICAINDKNKNSFIKI